MPSSPYDRIAAAFAGARSRLRPNEARYLATLVDKLERKSVVLDLGCGNGHPMATHLAANGFRIVGVDGSDAMLAAARQRLPDERWIHGRIEDVEFDESFDAVLCWDALFHVPRARWDAVIRKIHRWLKPGGRLMLSSGGLVDPDGDGFTDTMFGHEFYYDSLTPEALTSLLDDVGFDVILAEMPDQPTGGRNRGKRATIAVKR